MGILIIGVILTILYYYILYRKGTKLRQVVLAVCYCLSAFLCYVFLDREVTGTPFFLGSWITCGTAFYSLSQRLFPGEKQAGKKTK